MDDSFDMGQKIKKLRKQNHLTQKELGKKLNVTDKAISKWECNKGYPDITIVPLLAECLQVDASYFFADTSLNNIEAMPNVTMHEGKETDKLVQKIQSKKIMKILLLVFLWGAFVFIILYYNDRRIAGDYNFGFSDKEYSFNFLPGKNLLFTMELLDTIVLTKVAVFTLLGFILKIIFYIEQRDSVTQYILLAFITMLVVEVIKAFTSSSLVVVDVNNLLFFAIGFTLGYLIFLLVSSLIGCIYSKIANT